MYITLPTENRCEFSLLTGEMKYMSLHVMFALSKPGYLFILYLAQDTEALKHIVDKTDENLYGKNIFDSVIGLNNLNTRCGHWCRCT